MGKAYISVFPLSDGKKYSDFNLYLSAGDEDIYTEYRFRYFIDPINTELHYGIGPNNPANRELYRIHKAYVVKKEGENFFPLFRALSGGEIAFALREVGAGDFVGGVHGDELMSEVALRVNGRDIPLDTEYFCEVESFSFFERSTLCRCNTPEEKLMIHTQTYGIDEDKLTLSQDILWIGDGGEIQHAFTPMLTAQRLMAEDRETVISDMVELYSPDGSLAASCDTSEFGPLGKGEGVMKCEGIKATSVRVYGRESGFSAEAGYIIRDGSIDEDSVCSQLWIRYGNALDNKVYFDIAKGLAPKKGVEWKIDIYYRIRYTK